MKILVASSFPETFLSQLESLGFSVSYQPHLPIGKLKEIIGPIEVLLIRTFPSVQKELIDEAKALKLVCRAGVGMDHVDRKYLQSKGIADFHTPGANADSVGEQTLGMMLSLLHKLPQADKSVKSYLWKRENYRGNELQFKTVGLIGFGNTGRAVARRLKGFGCRIIAYDKYLSGFGDNKVEEVSLKDLFAHSQILSLHIPLNSETQNWIDSKFISQFSHPLYLLNLSRGKIVHLPSLLENLNNGKILGAALDVLPNERLEAHTPAEQELYKQLFDQKNVVLSPHVGGWSFESRENIQQAIINRLIQLKNTQNR